MTARILHLPPRASGEPPETKTAALGQMSRQVLRLSDGSPVSRDLPCDTEPPRKSYRPGWCESPYTPPRVRVSWGGGRLSAQQKATMILATIYTGLIIAALINLPDPHPFLR